MKSYASERTRTLLLRLEDGEALPDALAAALHAEGVASGWVRATGVLREVELRSYDGATGALGAPRRVEGPLLATSIEGSIGMVDGRPSASLRCVLAREESVGLETISGELVGARVTGVDAIVTALDDVAVGLAFDVRAGVVLVGDGSSSAGARTGHVRPGASPEPAPVAPKREGGWSHAIDASERAEPPRARPPEQAPMPARPARPPVVEGPEQIFPEAGDVVEHFAFGRCEVLKSDGDRLHLKLQRDGRIREIALEMLKVVEQPTDGPRRRFKLERKM